jgi:ribosome-associated GTPase EngA
MILPLVAIVGRPNVGKSTFFNKIAGRRISIVDNKPGVTRDRLYADVDWCGYRFTLIDTGGIELKSEDTMWKHIRKQAEVAVLAADVIIFIVDGRQGATPDDRDVAEYLRKSGKPVVLAVNKIDGKDQSPAYDFYSLGLGEPMAISSEQSLGLGDLLDEVVGHFDKTREPEGKNAVSIAVVGKPNAGKSSLVNKILGFERVIVDDLPGTTRDAVDTPISLNGKNYIIIDTAGIRKKAKVEEDIEYYSVVRAISAIRKADVVAVVIDAGENITEQDVKICALANEAGKPSVIVMNKWDLIEKDANTINRFNEKLKYELKFMDYFKAVYVSALTGKRLPAILEAADEAYQNASKKIQTGLLNDVVGDAVAVNEPPARKGVKLKVNYIEQIGVNPPSFALFVSEPELMHFSYKRYIENAIRKAFDFTGTPIRIFLRKKNSADS